MMSTHAIEVVRVGSIEPHPNPEVERMEITKIWGWQCCVGKGQFREGDLAVYVPPDFLVPTSHPAFAFLRRNGDTMERVRVRRFKGALSQGLLIPVPDGLTAIEGADVREALGIERYEPPLPKQSGGHTGGAEFVGGPSGLYTPKFDVENLQRYPHLLVDGEPVVVTEKIHGANARYVWAKNSDGEWTQFCGSRTNWMADAPNNIWWKAFRACPAISVWCQSHPEVILYGEAYGQVQDLRYGTKPGEVRFAAFAALEKMRWWNVTTELGLSAAFCGLPLVPLLAEIPYSFDAVAALAEGDSRIDGAGHLREGCVAVPREERTCDEIGRVIFKSVSNAYLERK